MMRVALALLASFIIISCQPRFEKEITPEEIENHISYLASDELAGRYPGTPEDKLVTDYISSELNHAGLGMYDKSGIQSFEIVTELVSGPENHVSIGETELVPGADFTPFSFSASGSASAEVVFAGFGFQVNTEDIHWDDYAGLKIENKWVILLRGVPGTQDGSSPFVNFSEDRGKALNAADKGAAGVILVSGSSFDQKDNLEDLKGKQFPISIPVIHMSRSGVDMLLRRADADSLNWYESQLTKTQKPASFETHLLLDGKVDLQPKKMNTANVIGILEGADPSLKSQYLLIGAHHDHLGMGGEGSSSRRPDTIAVHNGADDNASGVAGVLEIAEQMTARSPARSMIFVYFWS